MDPQAAFADAVARARQIAAKINQPGQGGTGVRTTTDRPGFDSKRERSKQIEPRAAFADAVRARQISAKINQPCQDCEGDSTTVDRPGFKGLEHIDPQCAFADAVAGARQIAKRLRTNQMDPQAAFADAEANISTKPKASELIHENLRVPSRNRRIRKLHNNQQGFGVYITEETKVPEKIVGLIIGKGGKLISRLQAESGCKIQIARAKGDMSERSIILTGTSLAISEVKENIIKIIKRTQKSTGGFSNKSGNKEKTNTETEVIPDKNIPTTFNTAPRITEDQDKCQRGREMTKDLFASNDMAEESNISMSVLHGSEEIYEYNCSPCLDEGRYNEALKYCVSCKLNYCKKCLRDHNKFPSLKVHRMQDTAPIKKHIPPPADTKEAVASLTELCELHPDEITKMYCSKHAVVCCTVCIALDHRECEGVDYIPKIAKGVRACEAFKKYVNNMEELKEKYEQTKEEIQEEIRNITYNKDEIIKDIERFRAKKLQN